MTVLIISGYKFHFVYILNYRSCNKYIRYTFFCFLVNHEKFIDFVQYIRIELILYFFKKSVNI